MQVKLYFTTETDKQDGGGAVGGAPTREGVTNTPGKRGLDGMDKNLMHPGNRGGSYCMGSENEDHDDIEGVEDEEDLSDTESEVDEWNDHGGPLTTHSGIQVTHV